MTRSVTLFRWAAVGWAFLTAVLLLAPGSTLPGGLPPVFATVIAWLVHFGLFLVLAWLARRSMPSVDARGRTSVTMIAVLAAFCVVLETLQIAVPARAFELSDLAFGGLGIGLGWSIGRARRDR